MYQVIKAGRLLGEFHFYSAAQLVAAICHAAIYFNGPKGLERLQ